MREEAVRMCIEVLHEGHLWNSRSKRGETAFEAEGVFPSGISQCRPRRGLRATLLSLLCKGRRSRFCAIHFGRCNIAVLTSLLGRGGIAGVCPSLKAVC